MCLPANASVKQGNSKQFSATMPVTWSVEGNTSSNTTIDQNGLLTLGNDEESTYVEVKASLTSIYKSVRVLVLKPQQLDYIASTGTQYINTLYKPTEKTKVIATFETQNLSTTFIPFGARANAQLDYILGINFNGQNYIQFNTNTAEYFELKAEHKNTKMRMSLENGLATIYDINNQTTTSFSFSTRSSFQATQNLYLGCSNNNGATQYLGVSYKFYGAEIYEDGTLVRNFVPYINENSEVGVYDLVQDVFYSNAGTGDFIAGNPVE